jgi:lipoate-protein ligase A
MSREKSVNTLNAQPLMMNLDEDLLERVRAGVPWTYRSWEPESTAVVLGRGNKAASEVHTIRCQNDNIPVLRRRGGGGTVVLCPGIVVISLVKRVNHEYYFKEYFQQINGYVIEALESLGMTELHQRGISDICIRDRKILGASMYRSKKLLFYTASLMVSNRVSLIERYLRHPSKEPDYRKGRSHDEFLTTITREYPKISLEIIKEALDSLFQRRIPEII